MLLGQSHIIVHNVMETCEYGFTQWFIVVSAERHAFAGRVPDT